ncbi:MAG: hypothetical protein AAF899_10040 [Pseudomonadota bacterium]
MPAFLSSCLSLLLMLGAALSLASCSTTCDPAVIAALEAEIATLEAEGHDVDPTARAFVRSARAFGCAAYSGHAGAITGE